MLNTTRRWCNKSQGAGKRNNREAEEDHSEIGFDSFTETCALVHELREWLSRKEVEHFNGEGEVNARAITQDRDFLRFEVAVCRLQHLPPLWHLPERHRIALVINVYNLLVRHGLFRAGVAENNFQRMRFFEVVSYNIGGSVYSLSDLEHGILRGNRPSPLGLLPPFFPFSHRRPTPAPASSASPSPSSPSSSSSWSGYRPLVRILNHILLCISSIICVPAFSADPRAAAAVTQMDPRIHFALNW